MERKKKLHNRSKRGESKLKWSRKWQRKQNYIKGINVKIKYYLVFAVVIVTRFSNFNVCTVYFTFGLNSETRLRCTMKGTR